MAKIVSLEEVDIDSLVPYPGNANRGDVEGIKESLSELDQYRAIVCQVSTRFILAGNHTWLSAKESGWRTIMVEWVECTDEEARKILLADNKHPENGNGYDKEALATLLRELDGDFRGTGFDKSEVDKLLDELDANRLGEDDGEQDTQDAYDPVTEEGDVWVMGHHRLVCGSSLDPGTLFLLLDGELAHLTVTSPPYNQKLNTFKPSGMQKENPAWVERMSNSYADDLPEDDYQLQQLQVLENVGLVTRDDGAMFYNHKIRYRDKAILSPYEWLSRSDAWRIRQEIIWDRGGSITLNARMFMPSDERIYWLTKSDKFVFNDTPEVKAFSTVWNMAAKVEVQISAPFPPELPQRCIQATTGRGDIVMDPYGGSGTVLRACERMERRARIVELNPAYCDVIVREWEKMTGGKAERIKAAA